MRRFSGKKFCLCLALIMPCIFLVSVMSGSSSIGLSDLLFMKLSEHQRLILLEIRLPRALLSCVVGAVLAMSGAVLQGLFRNPLADPSLIGVTAGASAGASLSIMLGAQLVLLVGMESVSAFASLSVVTLGAFLGGMLAVILVYQLSTTAIKGTSVSTMLLVGIAITSFAGALNSLLSFFADNEMLRRMSLWQMGNLDLANWARVQVALAMLVLFVMLLRNQAKSLNALLLGESEARYLGVDVVKVKRRVIFLAALGAGVCTALAGAIAFVGLIVPHLMRLMIGPDHKWLILASGLFGGILLMSSDVIARLLLAPAELPVGIMTAFLGVPFFLFLLRQQRRTYI